MDALVLLIDSSSTHLGRRAGPVDEQRVGLGEP